MAGLGDGHSSVSAMLQRPDHISDLIEAAASVVGQSDLRAVLYETVEAAMHMTGARYGALGVIGQHQSLVEFLHVGLTPGQAHLIGPLPTGRGVLGTLIRSTDTIRLDKLQDHPDSVGFPANHPPMGNFLGVPVRLGSHVYGNLYLTEKPGGFTAADQDLIESLSVVAGAAVSTARLQARLKRTAVVEDRERIARDLHDAIIQDLFAVGLSLQGMSLRVEDLELRTMLTESVERLDNAISELRRFIFGLRPPVWSGRNLRTELADLIGQLSDSYETIVDLQVPSDLRTIDPGTVETAVQLVREGVSNALRHSGCQAVTVSIDTVDTDLMMLIADDGVGFDPATVNRGMGLDNMTQRSADVGGSVDIRSQVGAGTTISIRLPA